MSVQDVFDPKKRAEINNVQDKIEFEVNSVENMRYDSNSFYLTGFLENKLRKEFCFTGVPIQIFFRKK